MYLVQLPTPCHFPLIISTPLLSTIVEQPTCLNSLNGRLLTIRTCQVSTNLKHKILTQCRHLCTNNISSTNPRLLLMNYTYSIFTQPVSIIVKYSLLQCLIIVINFFHPCFQHHLILQPVSRAHGAQLLCDVSFTSLNGFTWSTLIMLFHGTMFMETLDCSP